MATVDNHPRASWESDVPDPSRPWLYTLGGVTALILLAIFLIGGDIATAMVHSSITVAALIGAGYVLWLTWLLSIALGLFRLSPRSGRPISK